MAEEKKVKQKDCFVKSEKRKIIAKTRNFSCLVKKTELKIFELFNLVHTKSKHGKNQQKA